MAVDTPTAETTGELRRELAEERRELTRAIESLRRSTHVGGALENRLPIAFAGAFAVGFVVAGGIGATARLVFRRRRERRTVVSLGPFAVVER